MDILFIQGTNYIENDNEYAFPDSLKKLWYKYLMSDLFLICPEITKHSGYTLWLTLRITNKISTTINANNARKGKLKYAALIEFPYNLIEKASEQERNTLYTKLLFQGLKIVLQRFNISGNDLEVICNNVLNEITQNPKSYQYHELEIQNRNWVRESRQNYYKNNAGN